jgi:hypothetical protein
LPYLHQSQWPPTQALAVPIPRPGRGIGWGLGIAADFDIGGKRVVDAEIVSGLVRVKDSSSNVGVSFVLEAHSRTGNSDIQMGSAHYLLPSISIVIMWRPVRLLPLKSAAAPAQPRTLDRSPATPWDGWLGCITPVRLPLRAGILALDSVSIPRPRCWVTDSLRTSRRQRGKPRFARRRSRATASCCCHRSASSRRRHVQTKPRLHRWGFL